MKKQTNFSVLNLSQQDIPIITEDTKTRYSWVPIGIMDQESRLDGDAERAGTVLYIYIYIYIYM